MLRQDDDDDEDDDDDNDVVCRLVARQPPTRQANIQQPLLSNSFANKTCSHSNN
jgi:hypothetical protein